MYCIPFRIKHVDGKNESDSTSNFSGLLLEQPLLLAVDVGHPVHALLLHVIILSITISLAFYVRGQNRIRAKRGPGAGM